MKKFTYLKGFLSLLFCSILAVTKLSAQTATITVNFPIFSATQK